MNAHFLEPLDVLFLRGNRLFGDAGSYGESMVPPWPSAAAGAIRSAILARDGVDLTAFVRGDAAHPSIGKPDAPGAFRVIDFQLAWHGPSGEAELERLYPLPADLFATCSHRDDIILRRLTPILASPGILSSCVTDLLSVVPQPERAKPVSGLWLTETGMRRWLAGELPDVKEHLAESDQLWANDERVGIGLDPASRRADDGKLFTMQAVALRRGVGFVAAVEGDALADGAILRLGGDGRGAVARITDAMPLQPDLDALAKAGRCRLILTAPGVFPDGWRLPGMATDGTFDLGGVRGRVTCAAVPRAEVVSGWNLARWRPKPAHRATPAGSIYWIENLDTTAEALRKLAGHGLWPEEDYDVQRRAEGFNRFTLATY